MSNRLQKIEIKNFRSIASLTLETGDLNIFFGPNGSGKSTFLDAIWFLRDCAIRGTDQASSERNHGIGMLWDGAVSNQSNTTIMLETDLAIYEVSFGYSSGRIEPYVGENLYSKIYQKSLIRRLSGSDKTQFYHSETDKMAEITLREPEKPSLNRYLYFGDGLGEAGEISLQLQAVTGVSAMKGRVCREADEIVRLLQSIHFYNSRSIDLYRLKTFGSESHYHHFLYARGKNLWSVLRNLHDRRDMDKRYDTIMMFMKKSFPGFRGLLIELTGPNTVYGSFIEENRSQPIQASGVSDGHLQMLVHLTALFSEEQNRESLLIFDEPETSLHPYAIAVLAEAIELASKEWNKQIFVATHSPVLVSQFEPEQILATELGEQRQTIIKRVSELEDIQDLLEQYAIGSLYMAELIAPQSQS